MTQQNEPLVYQGQFGEFTITDADRQEVVIYRSGLIVASLCFAIATGLLLAQGGTDTVLSWVTLLYSGFCLALGVSLWTIHIYMKPLHRALQAFWLIGVLVSLAITYVSPDPLALTVYNYPLTLLGVGFVFAALTGIFFKEAFCFDRLVTKLLTPLVPGLLLGHMAGWLPVPTEQALISLWAVLFIVFSVGKITQPIPADIGDKSVFAYLKQQAIAKASTPHQS